jgi:hypothetical protein
MRLGITLSRIGNAWQVTHLPSVPLAEQLAAFKAKQVGEGFGSSEETLVVALTDTIKRHANKHAAAETPKPKKK